MGRRDMATGTRDMTSIVRMRSGATGFEKHITDPIMAHFFGTIQSSPITLEMLITSMASLLDRDTILTKLQYFEAVGIIEISSPADKPRGRTTIYPTCEKCPQRNYNGFALDEKTLSEEVDLSPELKKETLFLYSYGPNLNYYKMLNVASDVSNDEVCSAHHAMLDLFDPKHYAGKKLGSYARKLAIVGKVLE